MLPSNLMDRDEIHRRYEMAKREAASELQCYVHALTSSEDVVERMELAFLWRLVAEGNTVSDSTWEMMLEATND